MSALPFPLLLTRLGLTLLHALWLLAVLGLVAWLGLALLRRASAQARYLWACVCLLAMPVACLAAFAWLGSPEPGPLPATVILAVPASATVDLPPPSFWEGLRGPVAPWLALAWLAGALLQVLRLGGAVWRVQRLFLREAEPAPPAWEQSCRQLAGYLGIPGAVRLLVSPRVASPLTLGWLRPVVLLPASSLLHLSPEALEAVLAHELAHVRRLDYLANLIQTLIDAFLFFHPAARWLSGQIRELREHCCDDEAAGLCGDPVALAEGLAALERLRRTPEPACEPALAAAQGSLMSRITRMLAPQPTPLPSWRGLALVLAAASIVGAATLILPQERPAAKAEEPSRAEHTVPLAMTLEPVFYPPKAWEARLQGTVKLLARSRVKGAFMVQALEGPPPLRAAAEAYVRHSFARLGKAQKDIDWQITMTCRMPTEATSLEKVVASLKSEQGKAQAQREQSLDMNRRALEALAVAEARAERDKALAAREQDSATGATSDAGLRLISTGTPPPYPAQARVEKIQGVVDGRLRVNPDGAVSAVVYVSGPPHLVEAAMKAWSTWRFERSAKGGVVAVQQSFRLESRKQAVSGGVVSLREQEQRIQREENRRAESLPPADATVVSSSDPALQPISKVAVPGYPPIARMARIQGDVDVELTVAPDGTVKAARAVSGAPQLRQTAEQVGMGWTFQTTPKGGTATIRIPFRLQ